MTGPAQAGVGPGGGLGPALSAMRARLGLVALRSFSPASAGGGRPTRCKGWITDHGRISVARYSRMTRQRSPLSPLLFAFGYLLTWVGAGLTAFAIGTALNSISGGLFAWARAGRWAAGATLVAAAVCELTPLKDVCLGKCRSPLGALLGSWRDGWSGALNMGARNGAWCVGCCWALMASLFALGIMSVVWMAVVAGLIAFEKTIPWRRIASSGTAAVLVVIGVLLLAAPTAVPGLTVPGSAPMQRMTPTRS